MIDNIKSVRSGAATHLRSIAAVIATLAEKEKASSTMEEFVAGCRALAEVDEAVCYVPVLMRCLTESVRAAGRVLRIKRRQSHIGCTLHSGRWRGQGPSQTHWRAVKGLGRLDATSPVNVLQKCMINNRSQLHARLRVTR